jgi:O-antigen ligase
MYCLYMSSVRSALLGLLTFLAIYTYATNRKQFVIGGGVLVLVAAVTSPYWLERFNPELGAEERGVKVEVLDYGSGRPRLWLNDLRVFADRPIDEMLAGAGIGNRSGDSAGGTVYGHNDWLEMLTQTGLIGFLLFATLQAVILRKILRMHGNDRYRFLGFFAAVNIMMLVSNSYAWRIQVSQLYYMMLAFIEIPTNRSEAEGAHIRGQSMEHGESV